MRRIAFGILWFVGLFIVISGVGGGFAAAISQANNPKPATDFSSGYAQGHQAGQEFGRRYGALILFGSLVVSVVGTAFGVLPGTKKKAAKPEERNP